MTDTEITARELAEVAGYANDFTELGFDERGWKPELNEVVAVWSRGRWYRGVVTKVTPTKAVVSYVTPGGLEDGQKLADHWHGVDVEKLVSDAAASANANFDYYTREANSETRQFTHTSETELARYAAIVEGGREAHIAEHVAQRREYLTTTKERARVEQGFGFTTITNKNAKHADIAVKNREES